MRMNQRSTKGAAILTGGILAASFALHGTPAQASSKGKYKAGAVVLGAASAYFLLKGKTVPAAVAGAGAYYAYKKSQKSEGRYSQYPDRYPDDRYSQYPGSGGNVYPDDQGYDQGNDQGYGDQGYGDSGPYTQYPDYGYNGLTSRGKRNGSKSGGKRVVIK